MTRKAITARAYYNEHDPFAAAWLRELIKAGHIAPGDVDERSIEDVCPDDLAGYVQCHFFAGIGVWSHALRLAGWPDNRAIWTGSCPCQPFSAAGKGAGFDDERHLWPAFFDLIQQCNPPVVVGEQVASKDGLAWLDLVSADVEGSGRAFAAADLCAAGFGAPHIRQRSFWVAHTSHGGRGVIRRALEPGQVRYLDVGSDPSSWLADAGRGRVQPERGSDRPGGEAAGDYGEGDQRERVRAYDRLSVAAGGVAHACGSGSSELGGRREQPAGSTEICAASRMADADGGNASAERKSPGGQQRQQPRDGHAGIGHNGAPSAHSFWSDADWLGCRDGKWRPVEPGTFPLAHGAANRVGRLRGYGNAIVGPVAQGFIEAVMASEAAEGIAA